MASSDFSSRVPWRGRVLGVQPRIALMRSFDERAHSYLGYALRIRGELGGEQGEFLIGIGKAAQAKNGLRVGDLVSGSSAPVADPRREPVGFYKTVGLRVLERANDPDCDGPPWTGIAPELVDYRANGDRRLDPRTYASKCLACIWGCRMAVEIIVDHWNPSRKRHRFETFCYGPRTCPVYRAGATRKVPGREPWMVYEEDECDSAANPAS